MWARGWGQQSRTRTRAKAARATSSADTTGGAAAGGASMNEPQGSADAHLKHLRHLRACAGAAMVKRLFVVCSQKENYFELFSKITLKSGEAIEVDQAPWMDIEVRAALKPCATTDAP